METLLDTEHTDDPANKSSLGVAVMSDDGE